MGISTTREKSKRRRTYLHADQLELHQLHLKGLLLSLQLGITNSSVGMRNSRYHGTGKVTLLLGEPVGAAINCGSIGELIHPLLRVDVHVMGEHIGQLVVFLADRLLVV